MIYFLTPYQMKKFFKQILYVFGFLLLTATTYAAAPVITGYGYSGAATGSYNGTSFYDNGDDLYLFVTFDQTVNVTGNPQLRFKAPDNYTNFANYFNGDGTQQLTFKYTIGNAPDLNVNDWNDIDLPTNILKVTAGNSIKNAGGEDAVLTIGAQVSEPIKIDSKAPTWDKVEISSTAGSVVGNTRYLPGGASVLTKSYLTENDTRLAVDLGFTVGGGAVQTVSYANANGVYSSSLTGHDKDAQKTTHLTGDGVVALSSAQWIDQAGKTATGTPALVINDADATVTQYIVDSTPPVISFTDDIAAGPVASETFAVSASDNLGSNFPHYGYSVDNVCDANDVFPNTYHPIGSTVTINDESHNGQWVCLKSEDLAGNITYAISANPVNVDVTAPVFSSIGVTSDNTYDSSYGKADSILTFTLTLANPDSYDGNGSIDFTIDGTPYSANFTDPANSSPASTYTATFDLSAIGAANNASIIVTGVNFADFGGQNITNFVAGAPTPTVIIDTQSPVLTSASLATNGTGGVWARTGEKATFTLGFDEEIIRGTLNSASTASNISSLTKEFNISSWGTSDTIEFTAQNGDNGTVSMTNADFTIVDRAGNITTISTADINGILTGSATTDTTKPTATNIVITSNNPLDNKLAKTNDTIRIDFTTADNLSTNITLKNTNPTYSYILGAGHGFTVHNVAGTGAGQFIERFTDGTEQSEVEIPFRFVIWDEAGNKKIYTQADLTGPNVKFDRTDPIVQEVKISATSADGTAYMGDVPTYYAKQGDSLDFELQVCDYVDSDNNPPTGTIFGQAVTLTDDGLTGAPCTTPEGNPSQWRKWSINLAGIDGTEGLVVFSIDVNDNAGNTLANVTGTTDGSSVIFDKTAPLNPTDVVDALGVAIPNFKHRSKARFSWTNDADDTTNSAVVSGIQNYHVRFTNPANGGEVHRDEWVNSRNFDGRLSALAPWNGLPIPPRDITDPYDFHIQTRDKAGNDAPEVVAYTQPYTIGFVGRVTDENGNPLAGATVQVVSRFGETCDLNREICTVLTDANGEYAVVAQKDQDYNLTFFHQRYYLDKQESHLGHDDDTIVNSTLRGITSPHEIQTINQIVEITTDKLFVREDGKNVATKIWVASYSGEISYSQSGSDIIISSLSRIVSVTANNPNVQIINNGNNTYTIRNAGNILSSHSVDNLEQNASGVSAFGTSANYSSGSSRIATIYNAGNGNPHNTFGKYKTPAEWKAFADRLRYGVKPQILTYINRNGYEVFRGYRYGILGWDRPTMKRMQNQVKFRGISRRDGLTLEKEDGEKVISLAEKIHVMKGKFQKEFQAPEYKSDEFKEALESMKPLKRLTQKDAYKGILARNEQKERVNKWERRRSGGRIISRDPYARNRKVISLRLANGHSIKIEKILK